MNTHPVPADAEPPCRSTPEAMFPEGHGPVRATGVRMAKRICEPCPYRAPCLEYALQWAVDGVWSGTTPDEREAIRDERGIVAQSIVPTRYNPIPVHGTPASYRAHHRRGEKPCQACSVAESVRSKERAEARARREAS